MTDVAKPIGYASLSGLKELSEGYPTTIHLVQGAKFVAPVFSADLGAFWKVDIARRKWAELVAAGATQTGISFTRGTSKGHIDAWGNVTWEKTEAPLQDSKCHYLSVGICNKCGKQHDGKATEDPCPLCRPGTVCRTPNCGRLKQRS